MTERALVVNFLGNTAGLEAAIKRTSMKLNGMQLAGAGMQSLGSSMTKNLTVPIVGIGLEAARMAVKFQASMELLHTQAGVSQRAVGELSKGILNMAGSVGTAPQTLAEGMYHVASSLNSTLPVATRVSTEMKVLKVAAQGAAVGHADLVDVTNALDAAIVSGIKGVQNYSQAMGALNSVVGAGDMTMQDLADALSTGLLAPMKTYGLNLRDVGGALAVFGDNNIRGQEAATKLISAVRIMAAPSKAAAKELGTIGLSTLSLANDMRRGGLVLALEDLKKHLIASGDTASQQGLVIARSFGGRQSTGVQVLLQQLDRLQAKTADVAKGASGFGQAWKATTHNAAFQIQAGLDTMKADLTRFGNDVLPTLLGIGHTVVTDVDKVSHAFTSLPKDAQNAIIKGGLVLATIGPAMKLLGLWTGGIGRLWAISTKLQAWGTASAAASSPLSQAGRTAMQSVATMNVGTLIARSSLGGAGTGQGAYQPFGLGKNPAVAAAPTAAQTAAVKTSMASSVMSGVKSGLGTVLGRGMQGLMIAGIGTMVSNAVGLAVHGSVGKAISTIGTDASIGAGMGMMFGPEGAAGGALIGGLIGTFKTFIGNDAQAEGKAWADKFTSTLPGTLSAAVKDGLAKAGAKPLPPAPGTPAAMIGPGMPALPGETANPARWTKQWNDAFNNLYRAAWPIGQKTGAAFVTAMGSVKHITPMALMGNIRTQLDEVPKNVAKTGAIAVQLWRASAAQQMLEYATSLQQHGKLSVTAVNGMITSIERLFPGLTAYLEGSGHQTVAVIAKQMNLTAARHNLGNALNDFRTQWDFAWQFAKATNTNVVVNTATAMGDLTSIIAHGTRDQRLAAMREYDLLQAQAKKVWDNIAAGAAAAMASGHRMLGPRQNQASTWTPAPFVPRYKLPATHHAAAQPAAAVQQAAAASAAAAGTGMTWGTNPTTGQRVHHSAAEWAKIWATYNRNQAAGTGGGSGTTASSAAGVTPTFTAPSQTVAAQIQATVLANRLQVAQNAGNIAGQQNALNAEIKLEKSLLLADKKRLDEVNAALKNSSLSAVKRTQLLQNRLTMLQDIGTVEGQLGSLSSSLTGLTGSGSSTGFDLAPAGGTVKLPTFYDVRKSIGPLAARAHHHGGLHGNVVGAPQIVLSPTFHINAATKKDAAEVKDVVEKSVAKMADDIERGVSSRLHARTRSAGMRGT